MALYNSSCISQNRTKPTGVPQECVVKTVAAAGLSSLVCVRCVFFITHGFRRVPSSTLESWLLSWKQRRIILILKANEACIKSNRRSLPVFHMFPSDKSTPPFLASWVTAPWLMAREGKEGLINSESILQSVLCWPPGNTHWARKIKYTWAIKFVNDNWLSGIAFHCVTAARWVLWRLGFWTSNRVACLVAVLARKEVAVLFNESPRFGVSVKFSLTILAGLRSLGVLCRWCYFWVPVRISIALISSVLWRKKHWELAVT